MSDSSAGRGLQHLDFVGARDTVGIGAGLTLAATAFTSGTRAARFQEQFAL